jgi:tRNA(adenine34) deaminase
MPAGHPAKKSTNQSTHKWSAGVTSDSTHPAAGLFNQDAETIARELFSRHVSPKGPASGMRMLNFYINRAGKNLSAERHAVLEDAKRRLSGMIAEKNEKAAIQKQASTRKSAESQSA